MRTLADITGLLEAFEKKFGYKISGAQQQSEAWFKAKLGVLSASNAYKIVAKKDSETRHTYMCELIGQICTGLYKEISTASMDWGNQNEDAARAYYEFSTGLKLTPLPFIFLDNTFREGCSPDAFVNDKKGAEIKCPYDTTNFIKFLVSDHIKPEWKWQHQHTLRVTGAEEWDFCEYDPRMLLKPMKIFKAQKDEKMQKTLADAAPQFIADMDVLLAEIGIEFGTQWKRLNRPDAGVDEVYHVEQI